jgi:hypothetical protein
MEIGKRLVVCCAQENSTTSRFLTEDLEKLTVACLDKNEVRSRHVVRRTGSSFPRDGPGFTQALELGNELRAYNSDPGPSLQQALHSSEPDRAPTDYEDGLVRKLQIYGIKCVHSQG